MDLAELRKRMDGIDRELTELIEKRMDLAAEIALYKRENHIPIYDPAREAEKLEAVAAQTKAEYREYVKTVYRTLFEVSRAHQKVLNSQT